MLLAAPSDAVCYAMRLRGVEVGWACAAVSTGSDGGRLVYQSRTLVRRGPAVVVLSARAEATLAPDRTVRRLTAERREGATAIDAVNLGPVAAVPSALAPVLLNRGVACVDAVEETTGRTGRVCGRRSGPRTTGEFLGTPFVATWDEPPLPQRIEFPAQEATFERVRERPAIPAPPDLFADPVALDGRVADDAAEAALIVTLDDLPASANQAVERHPDGSLVRWRRAAPPEPDPRRRKPAPVTSTIGREAHRLARAPTVWAAAGEIARGVSLRIRDKRPGTDEVDPTAILASGRGSCRAHAALFAAIAAAAGIDARTVIGLVVAEGRLYPHAWVEVRVGSAWFAADPTEGAAPPRAPRIGLGNERTAGERLLRVRHGRVVAGPPDAARPAGP